MNINHTTTFIITSSHVISFLLLKKKLIRRGKGGDEGWVIGGGGKKTFILQYPKIVDVFTNISSLIILRRRSTESRQGSLKNRRKTVADSSYHLTSYSQFSKRVISFSESTMTVDSAPRGFYCPSVTQPHKNMNARINLLRHGSRSLIFSQLEASHGSQVVDRDSREGSTNFLFLIEAARYFVRQKKV